MSSRTNSIAAVAPIMGDFDHLFNLHFSFPKTSLSLFLNCKSLSLCQSHWLALSLLTSFVDSGRFMPIDQTETKQFRKLGTR